MANGDDQKPGLTQAEKDAADRELAAARAAGVQAEGFDMSPEAVAKSTAKRQEQEEEQKTANVLSGAVAETMGQDVAANVQAREGIIDQSPEARQQIRDLVTAVRGGASEMEQKDDQGNTWVMANDLVTGESGWVLQSKILANPQDFELAYSDADTRNRFIQNRIGELGAQGRSQLADSLSAPEVALLSAGNAATAGLLMQAADNPAAAARLRLASEQHDTSAMLGGLAGEITSGATMGLVGRGIAGTARAAGLAAEAGYLGSTAAKALGATQYIAKMPGLRQFLTRSATAAAATPLERGVAMRALNTVGKAVPLAAEAALGEMQVASAEAALNNSWATGSQLLDAATIGSVWGLGLGVGGAAMKKGFSVGIGKAREMVDNKAKEILNAEVARKLEEVDAPRTAVSFDDFEKRIRNLEKNENSRTKSHPEWMEQNEGLLTPEEVERLKNHTADMREPLMKAQPANISRAAGSLQNLEGAFQRVGIDPPSTTGPAAVPGVKPFSKRPRVQIPEGSTSSAPYTDRGIEIAEAAGGYAIGKRGNKAAKARGKAWLNETLGGTATKPAARAPLDHVLEEVIAIIPTRRAGLSDELQTQLENRLLGVNIPGPDKRGFRARMLGQTWDAYDEVGEALQWARDQTPSNNAKAVYQNYIDELAAAQLGTPDRPSVFGGAGAMAQGAQAALDKVQGARAQLFGIAGTKDRRSLGTGGKMYSGEDLANIHQNRGGVDLNQLSADLFEYKQALTEYRELAPADVRGDIDKAIAAVDAKLTPVFLQGLEERAFLRKVHDKVEGARKTGEIPIDTQAVNDAAAGKTPEPPQPDLTEKKFLGRTLGQWVLRTGVPGASTIMDAAEYLAKKPENAQKILDTTQQWSEKLDRAAKAAAPAFEHARTINPARVGAAITRGTGSVDTNEIDRMPAKKQAEIFDKLRADIEGLIQSPDYMVGRAAQATGELTDLAPALAQSVQQQMAQALFYLADELPQGNVDMLQPGKAPQVSIGQRHEFLMKYRAVNNPLVMMHDLGRGQLRSETAEAVHTVYPELYADMVLKVGDMIYNRDVPFQTRVQVGILMGLPGSSLMDPSSIAASQAAYNSAQTPEAAQVAGLEQRRRSEATASMMRGASQMPAATRSSAGRFMTNSEHLEGNG